MRTFNKKTVAAIAAGAVLTLTAGGVAFAYWTGSGSGSGSAATSSGVSDLALSQNPLNALYPGDSPQTLSGTVTNNGDQSAHLTTVTASIAVTGAAGCDATDYTLSSPAMTVSNTDLAKNASATFSGATLQFNNKGTNQDACKGATVSISYAIS